MDKGSTFTINVPFAISQDPTLLDSNERNVWEHISPEIKHQNGLYRVLLVEDFPANVLVATSMLSAFGYNVTIAHNGYEALELVKQDCFDAILMDVQMPVMDGYKATIAIREHEQQKDLCPVPIIGMTAHALQGDRAHCVSVGMNDYISKPYDPLILSEKLAYYIKERNYSGSSSTSTAQYQ